MDIINIFLPRLNAITGLTFRLPTEAEWEYAARGGNKSHGYKYAGSNAIDEVAWYDINSSVSTHPVKSLKSNELGLYDMSGNVAEWCRDRYAKYSNSSQTNPIGPITGNDRVIRGGNWFFSASCTRVSYRNFSAPDLRNNYSGFRLVLDN